MPFYQRMLVSTAPKALLFLYGSLCVFGLLGRLTGIPLLVLISVAAASTKLPVL